MKKLVCLLIILLGASGIQAQTWTQQYPSFQVGNSKTYVAHDVSGSSYLSRLLLLHCDDTGDTMWSVSYDYGIGSLGLIQLDNGNIVSAIWKQEYDTAGDTRLIVSFFTYDNDGTQLAHDSILYEMGTLIDPTVNALYPDNAGGYYRVFRHNNETQFVIQRMDGNSNLIWEHTFGTATMDYDIFSPFGSDANGSITVLHNMPASPCNIITIDTGNNIIGNAVLSNRLSSIATHTIWELQNIPPHISNGDEIIFNYDYDTAFGISANQHIYRIATDGTVDSADITSFATMLDAGTEMPDNSFIFFYRKYTLGAACEQGFVRLDNNFNFVEAWPDAETDTFRFSTYLKPNDLNGVFYAAYSGVDIPSLILNASQLDSSFKPGPTSVQNLSFSNGAVIYPNPSTGTFHINFPEGPASWRVTATDASGRQVWDKTLKGNNEIEATLPPGIYFIGITDTATGRTDVRKLMVQ